VIRSKKPGRSPSRRLSADLAAFVDELAQLRAVTEVILFGSRARGDNRPDSDADLLVILSQAAKTDLRRLHDLQQVHNQPHRVSIQLLGIEESQITRRLRAGDIIVYDAMVEGVSLYPQMRASPRHQIHAAVFSMDAAAAQWLAVVEDSIASAEEGHERLPASDPLAQYFRGYMPGRVHGLAVAAVRSAMWTAFYFRGQRPDRKMALDTMATILRWPTRSLRDLFVVVDGDDERSAQRVTRIATGYVTLVRSLAAEKRVSAKRLGYRSIAAYRLILEKYPSRLDNPVQTGSESSKAVLKSSQ
jgi:predicted nucleotidyltransferase